MGSSVGLIVKAFLLAVVFLGLIQLLLLGVLASSAGETKASSSAARRSGEAPVFHPNFDHNYLSSKRKVPNGPDPIHNRRTGDSRRPPGRA